MSDQWTTSGTDAAAAVPITVQVSGVGGDTSPDIRDRAEARVRDVLRFAHGPVLRARVRLSRQPDPGIDRPVVAQANVDVDGRFVRAQAAAAGAAEAVDLLHDRLKRGLQHDGERVGGHWEARRGRHPSGDQHEWRHGDTGTRRLPYFPRPVEEREVIRHKSVTAARCTVDEAAADMDAADYDFHLFTEIGSGRDSVLYRAGPTGYRVAQVDPQPEAIAPHSLPVTISDQPAPLLSTTEALQRMAVWDRPFLFFLDGDRGQGALLYHRYDGHYGVITPAEAGRGGEV